MEARYANDTKILEQGRLKGEIGTLKVHCQDNQGLHDKSHKCSASLPWDDVQQIRTDVGGTPYFIDLQIDTKFFPIV